MKASVLPASALLVLAIGPWLLPCVTAQTNSPLLVTNLVAAHSDFRRVNGQLYNIQKSVLWQELDLEFVSQQKGIVLARRVTREPIYETRWRRSNVDSLQMHGAYAGAGSHGSGYYRVKVGEEKQLGRTIALRNCRQHGLTTGKEFSVIAMRAGRLARVKLNPPRVNPVQVGRHASSGG